MPVYEHDCKRCRYLGQDTGYLGDPACNVVDLYICDGGPLGGTLIRRYSSRPEDYSAAPVQYAGKRYARAKQLAGL